MAKTARRARSEEWHVTVEGVGPYQWHAFCQEFNVGKPLFIELANFERQLMSASEVDPSDLINQAIADGTLPAETRIVRVKHEVSELEGEEVAIYYECHVKIDGPFRHDWPNTSRDLYRDSRWYRTRRSAAPFDPLAFRDLVKIQCRPAKIAGLEYEICIQDTNPGLDARWISR